jgi:hypothetical protein
MTTDKRPSDGKRGCPVVEWDGPYEMRCGLGASIGRCAYHGPYEQPDAERTDPRKEQEP